ncbi:hypothetical protein [Clostridium thermobutyricum]|uniref:hypothetical protein n=1 Tax=Clostridium thermobutyricum TaxID=29372 RepID=UPI0018AA1315|nr:hypothetical protein [Clostridium thermobutyricum]
MYDMFDMLNAMNEEGNVDLEKLQENEAKSKKENSEKKKTSKTEKVDSKAKKEKKSLSENEKIEKQLQKFIKIDFKVFGNTIKTFSGEEIKSIKLDDLAKELIKLGFAEFYSGVKWFVLQSNEDNTEAALIATYRFQNKG